MDSNFRFPVRKRRFPLRKGETGDGEHKRRLEPRPQRIRRFGYLGNRNLELPRRSLPPKVGHFSLSEAGRVVVRHRPAHLDAGLSTRRPSR
jgi:hypothetical protein